MKITDTIKYVGVNDETIDLFEGQYRMLHGVSYNSYVILDEKIAIMDTVDRRAMMSCGSFTRALASATRCCSPPESSVG